MPEEVAKKAEDELRPPRADPVGIAGSRHHPHLPRVAGRRCRGRKRPTTTSTSRDAAKVLDRHHYGLPKVKERILEYMAVRKLAKEQACAARSSASSARPASARPASAARSPRRWAASSCASASAASATRPRSAATAAPTSARCRAAIIHGMRQAGTVNPVFMLDEIDKVGADFRGDPSSALLEVLDPEQNHAFRDHYLDVRLRPVEGDVHHHGEHPRPGHPGAARPHGGDRAARLHRGREARTSRSSSWCRSSSRSTASRACSSRSPTSALRKIIREYTHEAGVRNLEREIGSICRKVARQLRRERDDEGAASARRQHRRATSARRSSSGARPRRQDEVGVATGVARTELGGDVLGVEVTLMPGKGALMLTGQLGEVMRESAQAALSYARSRRAELRIPPEVFEKNDIHIHVPAGAVPKEGPSAGITMATALISALTRRPVSRDVAMTGEITLRGRVLPVGGLKEKILAAHRAGIKTFVLPKRNEKDLRRAAGRAARAAVRVRGRHGGGAARRAGPRSAKRRGAHDLDRLSRSSLIFLFFIVTAFSAGLVREVISTSATIAGMVLAGLVLRGHRRHAAHQHRQPDDGRGRRLPDHLRRHHGSPGSSLAMVVHPAITVLQLGMIDQFLGAGFGAVKAFVIIQVLLVLFVTYPRYDLDKRIDDSRVRRRHARRCRSRW